MPFNFQFFAFLFVIFVVLLGAGIYAIVSKDSVSSYISLEKNVFQRTFVFLLSSVYSCTYIEKCTKMSIILDTLSFCIKSKNFAMKKPNFLDI